jgi:hypothetical protein
VTLMHAFAAGSDLLPLPIGERACPGLDPGVGVRGNEPVDSAVPPSPGAQSAPTPNLIGGGVSRTDVRQPLALMKYCT